MCFSNVWWREEISCTWKRMGLGAPRPLLCFCFSLAVGPLSGLCLASLIHTALLSPGDRSLWWLSDCQLDGTLGCDSCSSQGPGLLTPPRTQHPSWGSPDPVSAQPGHLNPAVWLRPSHPSFLESPDFSRKHQQWGKCNLRLFAG